MKMRNLLALLTAVLLLPTQNIPVHAEQKEFQVGVDSWLMQNSPFSLGNYYRLTEHDESIMKSNFFNIIYIDNFFFIKSQITKFFSVFIF